MIKLVNLLPIEDNNTNQLRIFPQLGKIEILNGYEIKDFLKSNGFKYNGAGIWQITDKDKIMSALKILADSSHEIIYYVSGIEKALLIMKKQLGDGIIV